MKITELLSVVQLRKITRGMIFKLRPIKFYFFFHCLVCEAIGTAATLLAYCASLER
jgi:hypothetical protein